MTSEPLNKAQQSFAGNFFEVFAQSLGDVIGTAWKVSAASMPDSPPVEPVRVRLTVKGALSGEFLLEFSGSDATMLAGQLLKQPAGAYGDDQSASLLKLIRTATDDFCAVLEPDYGDFTIAAAVALEAVPGLTTVAHVTVTEEGGKQAAVGLFANPALLEAITSHSQPATAAALSPGTPAAKAPTAEAAKPQSPVQPSPSTQAASGQPNLKLVMDVELNVTLRFGQRQITLREVLDLTSGSVIELDRQVEEPIELLLDGKVIARGEAVVVDGNYGLRITDIPQPLTYQASH